MVGSWAMGRGIGQAGARQGAEPSASSMPRRINGNTGLVMSGMRTPTVLDRRMRNPCASAFGAAAALAPQRGPIAFPRAGARDPGPSKKGLASPLGCRRSARLLV